MFKSRLNSWILLGIFGLLVVVFWDVIKYKIEDLKHAQLSITSERKGRIL